MAFSWWANRWGEVSREPTAQLTRKQFKPKNPELPSLQQYRRIEDEEFWAKFPANYNSAAKSNIKHESLKDLIKEYGTEDEARAELVLQRLKDGASIGCKGLARMPTVQKNCPDAYDYGAEVSDSVASWIKDGYVMGPMEEDDVPPNAKINGILTRVKPNGAVRVILNLSGPKGLSVNDGIDADEFPAKMSSTEAWLAVLNSQGKGCWMVKTDWADAYKHIPVAEEDTVLQWFEWGGRFFKELCLVFGGASSAGIFDATAKTVLELVCRMADFPLSQVCQHLDDMCAAAKEKDQLEKFDAAFESVAKKTGIKLAPRDDPEKAFAPARKGIVFGVSYDTEQWCWSIPGGKLQGILLTLEKAANTGTCTAKEAKSLVGKMIHIKALVPAGRFNIDKVMQLGARANREEKESTLLEIEDPCRRQIWFWRDLLLTCSGLVEIPRWPVRPTAGALDAYTDAAGGSLEKVGLGTGGVLLSDWLYMPWSKPISSGSCKVDQVKVGRKMAALELIGPLCVVCAGSGILRGRDVRIWVDNAGSVAIWKKGYSNSCRLSSTLVTTINTVASWLACRVFIEKITRRSVTEAVLADDLSKADFLAFRRNSEAAGMAMACQPLRIPPALVRWAHYPQPKDDLAIDIISDLQNREGWDL